MHSVKNLTRHTTEKCLVKMIKKNQKTIKKNQKILKINQKMIKKNQKMIKKFKNQENDN
jgi:predicted protein tyrosine phosphatase